MINNLLIIIRTCGEKSLNFCINQCKLVTDDVHVVREEPFYKSVVKTFEISSQSSKDFLLTLDADIRPCDGSIINCLNYAKDKNFFRITNKVDDKFIGTGIYCGNNLINNKYSSQFYKYILSNKPSNPYKPESSSFTSFCSKNSLSELLSNITIGSHMEDQYYHTIYNAMRNRIIKSNDTNKKKFLKELTKNVKKYPDDHEYQVALIAARDGLKNKTYLSNKADYIDISQTLSKLKIQEKIK